MYCRNVLSELRIAVTTPFCANLVQIPRAIFAASLIRRYAPSRFFCFAVKRNRGLIAILDEVKN